MVRRHAHARKKPTCCASESNESGGGLVFGDAVKARAEARRKYLAACGRLEKRRAEIAAYTERDRPAFTQWLEAEFADVMQDTAQLSSEARELEMLADQVRAYADVMQCSFAVALAAVRSAVEAGTEQELWEEVRREMRERVGPEVEEDTEPEDEPRHESRSDRRRREAAERKSQSEPSAAVEYLKALYRKIVRILHPDVNGEHSPVERALWQAAQEAYAWRDTQRLEALLDQIEGGGQGSVIDLAAMPIGDIVELRKDVDRRLSELAREIAGYKKDIAWNFRDVLTDRERLAQLRRQILFDLSIERARQLAMLGELCELVASWERQKARRGRRRDRDASAGW